MPKAFLGRCLRLLVWAAVSFSVLSQALAARIEHLSITISVVDEAGQPVRHAAVWRTTQPCEDPQYRRGMIEKYCVSPEMLLRTAVRLRETFDYVLSLFQARPLAEIWPVKMLDNNGTLSETPVDGELPFHLSTGRVNQFTVAYVFLKQGYEPALFHTTVSPDNNQIRAKVVMKADRGNPRQESAYRAAYERLRYELSDYRRNASIMPENVARLIRVETELKQAAEQAETAGDNRTAALIYYRLATMPSVMVPSATGSSQISGYKSSGGGPNSAAYMAKSAALDPESPYWAPQLMERRLGGPARSKLHKDRTPEEIERLRWVADVQERWMLENRERVWPDQYARQGGLLSNLGQWERAYKWYKDMERHEPAYDGYGDHFRSLERNMRFDKVPIPPDWELFQTYSDPNWKK